MGARLKALFSALALAAVSGACTESPTDLTLIPEPASGLTSDSTQQRAGECDTPSHAWIFCDDFERDRLSSYFEYDAAGGAFARTSGVGVGGSTGMRAHWAAGAVAVGNLKVAFGRTPSRAFRAADAGTEDHREIFWRVWVRNESGWTGGGGYKLSRATVLASPRWTQAMIAHVWAGSNAATRDYLINEPVRGTDEAGRVVTTGYNDFANFRWLGAKRGREPLFGGAHVGQWHCVEARVRLNDAGAANGVFEIWVDGRLDSSRTDLNWVGSYSDFGINAVILENYWNGGSPGAQERYLDNFVVSTERIGC